MRGHFLLTAFQSALTLIASATGLGAQYAVPTNAPEAAPRPPPPWKTSAFPILTVPVGGSPITLDGALDLEGEWKDACAMSGFYQKDLNAVAAPETQVLLLLKIDPERLYLGARTPIYPVGSQLTAFEKENDKPYGVMSGDHMVFELLPVRTRDPERIGVTGSFTLLWNPLDTLSDQHLNAHPGQEGLEWSSGARVASRITSNAWETELELPLKHLPDVAAKPYVELPPKAGDYWSAGVARRFGKAGENLFATWDNSSLTVQESGMGAQCRAWTRKPVLRFADGGLALQVLDLGNLPESQLHTDIRLYNRDPSAEHTATLDAHVQDSKGRKLWAQSQTVKVPPGQRVVCPPFKAQLKIEPRGSLLYLRATQDGEKPLFDSSALELVRFDDVTRQQFRRSIEVLRKP